MKDLNKLARDIIQNNQYMNIATSSRGGTPWVSPVVYVYDKDWNLYFVSMLTSKHCMNIKINNKVAVAIFDSTQLWGDGVGLQIEGESEVVSLKDSVKIAKIYGLRKYPYGGINTKQAMNFIKSMVFDGKKYKIYKITPKVVWMNDPNSNVDVRTKIDLNK